MNVLFLFKKLFMFWLGWVFIAVLRLSLVAASVGCSLVGVGGLLVEWLLLLQSTDSRHAGFSSRARGLSCPMTRGIFLGQGWNLYPLHWPADSFFKKKII